jgi:RNA polymerase sigma factor (sigma-70 family)
VALSDTDLVARALRDDHDAFAELVRRYQSPLRAWLRRLTGGDFARADDLAQETFLRAYRRLGSFRGTGKFSTWLFSIAYNEFRNDTRRRRDFVQLNEEMSETLITEQGGGAALGALADLNASHCRSVCPPPPDARKNATLLWLDCLNQYRQQLHHQTTSAALFAQPPVLDFTDPPLLSESSAGRLQVLKTHTRQVVTLSIVPWIARETIWLDPATDQVHGSADLRRLVAPGCTYGYDVLVGGRAQALCRGQPVRQIIALLAQSHVCLSASTVTDLGRRFC